jgi:hypothetical protein
VTKLLAFKTLHHLGLRLVPLTADAPNLLNLVRFRVKVARIATFFFELKLVISDVKNVWVF